MRNLLDFVPFCVGVFEILYRETDELSLCGFNAAVSRNDVQ